MSDRLSSSGEKLKVYLVPVISTMHSLVYLFQHYVANINYGQVARIFFFRRLVSGDIWSSSCEKNIRK